MSKTQLARGIWAGFAATEDPFSVPNGMEANLRLIDDHIAFYTLAAPVSPESVLPTDARPGAGQIFSDGSYAVLNASAWEKYPARMALQAIELSTNTRYINVGSAWQVVADKTEKAYLTLAALQADTTRPAGSTGLVTNDPNDSTANPINGTYVWNGSTWTRAALQTIDQVKFNPVKKAADRVGFVVVGSLTKNEAGGSSSRVISGPEILITGGTAFASTRRLAPFVDLVVPSGEAAYVDLDGPLNGSGQLSIAVTSGGFTVGMSSGTFVTDRRVYLFINGTGQRYGGALSAQTVIPEDYLAGGLKNRSLRPAWTVIGRVQALRFDGTVARVVTQQLRVALGAGRGQYTINAITADVPAGQALYVDLDGPRDGNDRLTAQVTDVGYVSGGNTGIPSGIGFTDDRRIYLLINDGGVALGGELPHIAKSTEHLVAPTWMQSGSGGATFDPATRTLSWPALYLPVGNNGRVMLAAGSHTIASGVTFGVVYLDLADASTAAGVTTPATAVKSGNYFDAGGRAVGGPAAVPMLVFQGTSNWRAAPGFVPVSDAGSSGVVALASDDIVIKVETGKITLFIKGSKGRYLEQVILHAVRPFDPTGADLAGNQDVWRLSELYEAQLTDLPSLTFTRTRSGAAILTGGEIECAILEDGAGDYIGGWHGDELLSSVTFLADGVELSPSTLGTRIAKQFAVMQTSTLYRWNTQTPIATRNKRIDIRWNDGMQVRLSQHFKWSMALAIKAAMLTMLPIARRVGGSPTGARITDTAVRAPGWAKEDVSESGFAEQVSARSLPRASIWSAESGISAEVEIVKKVDLVTNYQFYISNSTYYNKLYYSFAGMLSTPLNHMTAVNEEWDMESVIKLTSNI